MTSRLIILAVVGLVASGLRATPTLLPVGKAPASARTTVGEVVLRAPPAEVFAVLADPLRWPTVLRDVERVEEHGRTRKGHEPGQSWRIHSLLLGHCHAIELRREIPSLVHFHLTDAGPGGVLEVDLRLLPANVDGAPVTRVEYTMRTRLPLGLDAVIDDEVVRRARERKILRDLADLEARFGGVVVPP